jgi:hypothetical protein
MIHKSDGHASFMQKRPCFFIVSSFTCMAASQIVFALPLSSDDNEAIVCRMCCTNVFSMKENELHVPDHSIEEENYV